MGLLDGFFNKPGPGIEKGAPQKKGMRLFFDILWREFWSLLKLNMLFLLCCIPIVTIPAAITGMTRITLIMVRDKNHFLLHDFFTAFKQNFLRSLGAGLLIGFALAAAVFEIYFYSAIVEWQWLRMLLSAIGVTAAVIVSIMSFYVFAQIALVKLSVKEIFKNAFFLLFVCIKRNALALLLSLVLLLPGVGLLPYSMPFVAMLLFSLTSLIIMFFVYPGIAQYAIKQEPEEILTAEAQLEPPDWRAERERIHEDK